jgi:hypothetical protein
LQLAGMPAVGHGNLNPRIMRGGAWIKGEQKRKAPLSFGSGLLCCKLKKKLLIRRLLRRDRQGMDRRGKIAREKPSSSSR